MAGAHSSPGLNGDSCTFCGGRRLKCHAELLGKALRAPSYLSFYVEDFQAFTAPVRAWPDWIPFRYSLWPDD